MQKKKKFLNAVMMVFSISVIAQIIGLFRQILIAKYFGISRNLDIYYSAFKIPDLIFNLIILGAVSSSFIPVFIDFYKSDEKKAWQLSQNFLNIMFSIVFVACAIMFIFARPLATLITPGFSGPDRELAIQLTRLMLLSPIIFSFSTVIGSILQAVEKFFVYAIAPVMYNIGIIIGAIYFAPFVARHGYPLVIGLGLGVVLGALMHLAIQIPSAIKVGFRFGSIFDFRDLGMRKIFKLMLPRTLGLGAFSIDSTITNAIASTMTIGSISVLNFANNLQFVPISVIGISAATAVFPGLSSLASGQEKIQFKHKLVNALKSTFFVVTALGLAMAIFSHWIINIIFGTGLFKGASVNLTASVLSIFLIGVIAQSLIPIMSRAFYALKNTRTPVIISVLSILINIGLSLFFTFVLHWSVKGLALAFSISGNLNFILLWIMFWHKFRKI